MKQRLLPAVVLGFALVATLPAHAQSSATRKELAAQIVRLQQPGIQAMARNLAQQPAAEMVNRAGAAIAASVPPDRRESVARQVQADAQRYMDEALPLVQGAAQRLAPQTLGALLEEKFTEDELRQIVAIMESPAYTKFGQLGDEMQRVMLEKLVTETRSTIEPKLRALDKSIGDRLTATRGAPAAAPARPASAARPAPAARAASR